MAESLWLSFVPPASVSPRGWRLDKLGIAVDPFQVAVNGSRAMHAIWSGIDYYEPAPKSGHQLQQDQMQHKAKLSIKSPDVPVVAIDTPSPIVFLRDEQIRGQSWHFNLFNNAWNVNYPVWEVNTNERFQFKIVL